jgi:hypothetical protein
LFSSPFELRWLASALFASLSFTAARSVAQTPHHDLDHVHAAESFEELEAATTKAPIAPASEPRAPAAPGTQGHSHSWVHLSGGFDVTGAYFSTDEPLEGGAHDPTHTGFNLQKFEVSLSGAVDPYFRLDSHIVFGQEEIDLEEVYGTTLGLPLGLQARFGKFLTRFGRINATHLHAWEFVDQPFELTRLFGGEGGRGLGVELSALLPLPWPVELVASATEASGEESARSFYGPEEPEIDSPSDLLYTTAIKQFFALTSSWSLAFGVSAAFGPNASAPGARTDIFGADLYLKYRPLDRPAPPVASLQSEWFYRRREAPDELLQDFGGYVQALYRFAERWSVAGRYEYGSPAYGDGGDVVLDPLDPEWTTVRRRYAANVTFYPTEFSRLRLQANRDVPGFSDSYWALFLAAELTIGAHGAHQF